MATLLRNKPPVPALPKEPPLPDQPPEPPLDEIAKGLNRLVATRHKRLDRATKHPPLERAIKQAGALQHARKQEHMQQEQVKTQRQAVQVQRAQATADSLGTVAEAAKKGASKPTGPLARPRPQQQAVTAPPVQSHAKPQQEAPAPSYGFEKRKQTPEDEQTAANTYWDMVHAANNPQLSEEARQQFRAKAERHKAAVFGSRPVPKYKEPKLPKTPAADTVEKGPAEPRAPRPRKASTLKPPAGAVIEKPATPEPPPRGFRRRTGSLLGNGPKAPPEPKTPERGPLVPVEHERPSLEQLQRESGVTPGEGLRPVQPLNSPPKTPEPPVQAPVRGEPTPLRGRFDTMIALLKGHKWGAFNRYTMPPQPPGVQRELQRAMNEQRNEGAEGEARRIERSTENPYGAVGPRKVVSPRLKAQQAGREAAPDVALPGFEASQGKQLPTAETPEEQAKKLAELRATRAERQLDDEIQERKDRERREAYAKMSPRQRARAKKKEGK